jgi:signal transduction histidine kinase
MQEDDQKPEGRLQFLHGIDRMILSEKLKLEDLFSVVIVSVTTFYNLALGYCYIESINEFLLLCSSTPLTSPDSFSLQNEDFINRLTQHSYILEEFSAMSDSLFPTHNANCATRTILPLVIEEKVWGFIAFEDVKSESPSPLSEEGVQEFLQIVRDQLIIALQIRTKHDELARLTKIQNDFFTKELDPSESLDSLIRNIASALPSIRPLRITPAPEIQILFYKHGQDYFTIRATSGNEQLGTRVSVKESITGMLVENPELPFYICDPRDNAERYKSYLGKDEGGNQNKEIRTELVIPLRWERKIIGVINLESELENAFKIQHIEAMVRLADKISSIINALQKRVHKAQVHDQANLYALNRFLDRFSRTYYHKMGSPISTVSLNLSSIQNKFEALRSIPDILKKDLMKNIKRCKDSVETIDIYHDRFGKDLPGFLIFGKYNTNLLVEGAIKDIRPEVLKKKYGFEVLFSPKEDYHVFCSLFLREHIYNILNNSFYSLMERKRRDRQYIGQILLETSLEEDDIGGELNRRCKIRILDNGLGMEKSAIPSLSEPGNTTKPGGSGFGLFAASRYLKSIGGRLELDSEPMRFFEVCMHLDIYDENLHKDLDAFAAIRREEY